MSARRHWGGTLRRAGQRGTRVREHRWLVVDADDPCVRDDALGDPVGVCRWSAGRWRRRGTAGCLPRRPGRHRAAQEGAGLPGDDRDLGIDLHPGVARLPVDGVVVLAAEPVVPDPGRSAGRWSPLTCCHGGSTVDSSLFRVRRVGPGLPRPRNAPRCVRVRGARGRAAHLDHVAARSVDAGRDVPGGEHDSWLIVGPGQTPLRSTRTPGAMPNRAAPPCSSSRA